MDAQPNTAPRDTEQPDGWVLAIDFGTSFSSAALAADDGVDLIDLHGDRRVPSMVLLGEDGKLLVGVLAANQAAGAPDRLERTPKAQVGRSPVLLLGGEPVAVVDAVSAIVSAFVEEARRRRGGAEPAAVTLTHPVRWGEDRRKVLMDAALAAGLQADRAQLVEEPVAAASAFRSERVRPGSLVAVYDLGGGTFDAAVLEATETGFVVAGPPGGDDSVGGEAFDERLLAHAGEQVAAIDPDGWAALLGSDERRWRRAHYQLRDQIRLAKETLSVAEQATVYVPGVDRDVLVTRAEFEQLIVDDVARTLDVLDDVIRAAGTTPDQLTAVYPVGGSSRIPLVANLLLARYGDRVVTWDDPQAAVALGAARIARHHLKLRDTPTPAAAAPIEQPPAADGLVAEPEPDAAPARKPAPVSAGPLGAAAAAEPLRPAAQAEPPPPAHSPPQPNAPSAVTPPRARADGPAGAQASRPPTSPRRRRAVPAILAVVALAAVLGAGVALVLGQTGSSGERAGTKVGTTGPASGPSPPDEISEAEAKRVVTDYERAYDNEDASELADLFAPDATMDTSLIMVQSHEPFHHAKGRSAIESEYRQILAESSETTTNWHHTIFSSYSDGKSPRYPTGTNPQARMIFGRDLVRADGTETSRTIAIYLAREGDEVLITSVS